MPLAGLLGGLGAGAGAAGAAGLGGLATGAAGSALGAAGLGGGAGLLGSLGALATKAKPVLEGAGIISSLMPKSAGIGGGIAGARGGLQDIVGAAAPGMQARQQALGQYQDILSGKTDITQGTGYQAGLEQAQQSLESSGAARGMQLSGMNVENLAGLGSQYYQQQRQQQLGELGQLAGITQPEFSATTGAMGDIASLPLQQMALQIAQRQGQAKTQGGTLQGLGSIAQAGGLSGLQGLYGGQDWSKNLTPSAGSAFESFLD